jgi:hypothetical protein
MLLKKSLNIDKSPQNFQNIGIKRYNKSHFPKMVHVRMRKNIGG